MKNCTHNAQCTVRIGDISLDFFGPKEYIVVMWTVRSSLVACRSGHGSRVTGDESRKGTERNYGCNMDTKRGFTLIELLVVIAIIALLMAILMPALRRARDQTRGVVCKSNLNQWGKIFYLYTHDNDSKFMVWKTSSTPGGGTWIVPLMPYYEKGGEKVRLCPNTRKMAEEGETIPARMAWSCEIDGKTHKNSYGINNWCYDLRPGVTNIWGLPEADRRAWRRIDQREAAYIPMFLECWRWGGGPISRSEPAPPDEDSRHNTGFGRYCLDRHAYTINVCFMDASVSKVRLKNLWDLKWHRKYGMAETLPTWPEWMAGLPGS